MLNICLYLPAGGDCSSGSPLADFLGNLQNHSGGLYHCDYLEMVDEKDQG